LNQPPGTGDVCDESSAASDSVSAASDRQKLACTAPVAPSVA
jgi:hypothetical protein